MMTERNAQTGTPQASFVHLSDPHLSSLGGVVPRELRLKQQLGYLSWRRRRRLEHRRELLDVLTQHMLAEHPQHIVLTGDLTHIGLEQEFRETAGWLRGLAEPAALTLVPGNHDATLGHSIELQRQYWADYLQGTATDNSIQAELLATSEQALSPYTDIGTELQWPRLRVRNGIAFIAVDSAIASAPLLAVGEVGAAQRVRLARLLQGCAQRGLFRVLCLHHCPLPGADKARKRLRDATAVRDILVEQGVELVLHGHNHRSHQRQLHTRAGAVPVICAPSASARGLHGHEPGGYHRFALFRSEGGWQLEMQLRRLRTAAGSNPQAGDAATRTSTATGATMAAHSEYNFMLRRMHAAAPHR